MSRVGGQRVASQRGAATARNYRPQHPRSTATARAPPCASAAVARNPGWPDSDYRNGSSWPAARTSFSVGEDTLRSRQGNSGPVSPTCTPHMASPFFTNYLQDKYAKLQEDHQNAQAESAKLNNQLSKAASQNRELQEKVAVLEALLREKRENPPSSTPSKRQPVSCSRGINTLLSGLAVSLEAATSMDAMHRLERSVQTTEEPPEEPPPPPEPPANTYTAEEFEQLVSVNKAELESLEADMKILRDSVRAKEEMWSQALEREQNYRENFARLSVELLTIRHELDARKDEVRSLVQILSEKKEELRFVQKDLTSAKKTILKYQKRQRLAEESGNQETQLPNSPGKSEFQEQQQQQQPRHPARPGSQPQSPTTKQKFKRCPSQGSTPKECDDAFKDFRGQR